MAFAVPSAGQPAPLDQSALQGLRKAMCPAFRAGSQASPAVSPAEVVAIHQAAGVDPGAV
ncbi:MAG: hypothetical protein ACYCW6_24425 [Candidatus Xenobia bacterium]